MKLLVFLGNPGSKYNRTRHNIGFMAGEKFAEYNSIRLNKKAFLSETGSGTIDGNESILIFPQTYMNESGKAVKKAIEFYRESPSNLIVFHDELELKFGEVRTKFGGGHKGHNGIRSIIAEIGSPDFHRIRFGIGRPENSNISVSDHVLSKFRPDEMDVIEKMMPEVMSIVHTLLNTEQ